jgi:type IV pilus assembly protein PilW
MGWSGTIGGVQAPVQIMGYEAHPADKNAAALTLSAALTACLANYKTGTDVLVIRRLSTVSFAPTVAASATTTTVGDVYLQGSSCTTSADGSVPLQFAALPSGGANFTLHQLDCTTVSQIRKYIVRIFYIATCNTCSGGGADTIPTLKVAELSYSGGSLQMVVRPLTPGIENMHFEFGVDSSGDGAPDSYSISNEAPLTTAPGFSWQNIVSVKAYLLVRDIETTAGYTSPAEYVFGSRTIKAFTDNYKRTVAASTIRLVNPSGARETP